MRSLIEESGPVTLVGEAESVGQTRLLFEQHAPDAVVLDLQLADGASYQLLQEFKRTRPACVVMVLTNFALPANRERCIALGADYFFDKSTQFERVVEVLALLRGAWVSTVPGAPASDGPVPATEPLPETGPAAELVLAQMAVAAYACDLDGRITFHNPAAVRLWGSEPVAAPDQWCGSQRLSDAMSLPLRLDAYPTRVALAHARDGSATASHELIVRRPDGTRRHVLSMPRPLLDASGTLVGAVDAMIDVTAARRNEAARAQREDVLNRALDASRLALWDLDVDSGRVDLSEGWSEMMGGPRVPTTTTFRALADLVPTEHQRLVAAAMQPALEGASPSYSIEHCVRRPAGDLIWILSEGKVVERDEQGRALRAIGTNRNITERKQAEIATLESEARFRELVELSADWYWEQDEQFRFTRLSSRDDHAGLTAAEHIGKTRWELPHEGVSEEVWRRHREQLQRYETFHDFELNRVGRDGRLNTVLVSGTPKFDASGRFCGYRGVARDITAQRLAEASLRTLEAQLREAQKLEALGTLAGGIAHDFNSIVGAILGNVALARDDIVAGRTGLIPLEQICKVALRARDLVQQILNFSRRQPHVLTNQPLRPLVEEAVTMLRSMLPRNARLHTTLSGDPLDVRADATQLQQLLLNLCQNAAHALGGADGRIEIGFDETSLDAAPTSVTGDLPAGRYARLWVRDNGHGMDAATQERIFEPFFTTKAQGHGTGLGLAIVRNIVMAHHGAISVTSALGQGSTFKVYLPAVDRETGAVPFDELEDWTPHGDGQHVLVVDDDEVMSLMMTTLLERIGYHATSIADPREALVAVRQQPDRYAIVVTDYTMREMSGLDLARHLAALWPQLPVLMTSGKVTDELRAQARQAGLRALLQKQNTAEQLGALVHRVLSAGPPGSQRRRQPMIEA